MPPASHPDLPALQALRGRGVRLTPQRRAVLSALAGAEGPLPAAAVHERVRERLPEVALETVYRTLRLLVREGLVAAIAFPGQEADRYELAGTHHHHRVCLGCGQVRCLPPCSWRPASGPDDGFRVLRHVYEEYGYCTACAAGMRP